VRVSNDMNIRAMKKFKLSAVAVSLAIGLSACDGDDGIDGQSGAEGIQGIAGAEGADGTDGINGQSAPVLTRLATVPTGAEVTGAFLTEEGDLFFNVQHPSDANTLTEGVNNKAFNKGTVGVLRGVNFNNLPKTIVNSPVPSTEEERQVVVSALGEYQIIGQTNDTFADLGDKGLAAGLGVHYGIISGDKIIENNAPDFNGYVSTGEGEGYLFTNWESYPGGVSRMKISKDEFGSWSVGDG